MVRFIGKNVLEENDRYLEKKLLTENESWYAKTFNKDLDIQSGINKFQIKSGTGLLSKKTRKVRCLDLTDFDMSDSPLKRFHQVTICGNYVNDEGKADPSTEYIITAGLPRSFSYSIKGNWTTPFSSIVDFSQYNGLVQAASKGKYSSTFGLATMSVWQNTDPLSIRLELECLDDTATGSGTNTLEAIDFLSKWALPSGVSAIGSYKGIPGPGIPPVSINYNSYDKDGNITSNQTGNLLNFSSGQRLSVLVGGMLFMDYCILTDISVSYPNTKAQYLHNYHTSTFGGNKPDVGIRLLPARCNISLTFKTVVGLTHTNFQQMISLRENTSLQDISRIDVTGVQNAMDANYRATSGNVVQAITTPMAAS